MYPCRWRRVLADRDLTPPCWWALCILHSDLEPDTQTGYTLSGNDSRLGEITGVQGLQAPPSHLPPSPPLKKIKGLDENPGPCSLLSPLRVRTEGAALIEAASSQARPRKVLLDLRLFARGVAVRGGCGRPGFVPGQFPSAVMLAWTAGGRHRFVGAAPIGLPSAVLERGASSFLQHDVRGIVLDAAGPSFRGSAAPG